MVSSCNLLGKKKGEAVLRTVKDENQFSVKYTHGGFASGSTPLFCEFLSNPDL